MQKPMDFRIQASGVRFESRWNLESSQGKFVIHLTVKEKSSQENLESIQGNPGIQSWISKIQLLVKRIRTSRETGI